MDPAIEQMLDRICCPEKHSSLSVATQESVARLNTAIKAGKVSNIGGDKVEEEVEDLVVREGGDVAYPVRRGIPILIVEEGIRID